MASNFGEIESFISKFKFLTSAGCKASLNFTSDSGRISVTLSANLGHCLPPPLVNQTSSPPNRPRRGAAYLRRQLRRKQDAEKYPTISSDQVENEATPIKEVNSLETDAVEVSHLSTIQHELYKKSPLTKSDAESDLKMVTGDDWINSRIKSYAADFANPEYLYPSYEPVCCNHNHIAGRGGHNVPKDGSQCCYHKCKKYPHYLASKPKT